MMTAPVRRTIGFTVFSLERIERYPVWRSPLSCFQERDFAEVVINRATLPGTSLPRYQRR
jgi:hypothetical protein